MKGNRKKALPQGSYLRVEGDRRGPTSGVGGNRRRSYLGVKADPGDPVCVTLPTHDEVPSGQVPHLPGLVIAACHLQPNHNSQAMSSLTARPVHVTIFEAEFLTVGPANL